MAGLLPIGSMWRSKQGAKSKASGEINLPVGVTLTLTPGTRLILADNQNKHQNDNAPDFYLYLAAPDSQQQNSPSSDDDRL